MLVLQQALKKPILKELYDDDDGDIKYLILKNFEPIRMLVSAFESQ